nr:recombinase family protein [Natranaerofaba carboxydovora]
MYARVSTREQAREGYSIEHQISKLKAYFELNGWNNTEVFADEGFSAKDLDRPKLKELINLIKENKIERVGTLAVDRMSRNMIDMLNFIEMCEEHDTTFVCPTINFDTSTPVGRMVLHILSAFAEFQRRMIADSVKSNMDNIVENKGLYLTVPPFGYSIDKSTGRLEIVEEEAYWIKKMAEKFVAGEGYRDIARWLNENNVKTKRSNNWSPASVKNILTNEIYTGVTLWNRRYYDKKGKLRYREKSKWIVHEDTHEEIFTPKMWEEINKRVKEINSMTSNNRTIKEKAQSKNRPKYNLSGMLYCGYCNSKMTTRKYSSKGPNKDKRIFVCSNYQKNGRCKFNYIFLEKADKDSTTLINYLKKINQHPNKNLNYNTKNHKKIQRLKKLQSQALEHNMKLINEKFTRQLKAYENGIINLEELNQAKNRLKKEQNVIENRYKFSINNSHKILSTIFYEIKVMENQITSYKLNPNYFTISK